MAGNSLKPIVLTDVEQKIFKLLLDVEHHYNLQTEVRIAGGWVRDKLLGKESNDIDIALYKMLGKDFCEKINDYFSSIGENTTKVHLIPDNDQHKKHLEIAQMHLYGIKVEFVNLRAVDSRGEGGIRKWIFGTAEEDAYLRDLTINSLFYNVAKSSVEDFTGQGIEHLKHGRIMTPLPPEITLEDDPLRVLRAIRFGDRFGFLLDEKLKTAAARCEVKDAISKNVKRERIYDEVNLMISGKDPVRAMTYICELSLFSVIFTVPQTCELASLQGIDRICTMNMDAVANIIKSPDCYEFNDGDKKLLFYAALLLPMRKFTYVDEKYKKVIMVHKIAEWFAYLIPYLIYGMNMDTFEVVWEKEHIDIPSTSKLRVCAGLLLDEINTVSKRLKQQICLWRISLLVSTLLYPSSTIDWAECTNGNINVNEKRQLFKRVEKEILKLGLEEVARGHLKSLVDGKVIMSALRLTSGSPVVGEWVRKVRVWQLANPDGTKEECIKWIEEETHSKSLKRTKFSHCRHSDALLISSK